MWDRKDAWLLQSLLKYLLPELHPLERIFDVLQEGADRSDPLQFLTCDRLASNYVQQALLLRRIAAQTRLAEENARRSVKDDDPNRELIVASTSPSADDIGVWLANRRALDQQYYKDVELLRNLREAGPEGEHAGVTRKFPMKATDPKRQQEHG